MSADSSTTGIPQHCNMCLRELNDLCARLTVPSRYSSTAPKSWAICMSCYETGILPQLSPLPVPLNTICEPCADGDHTRCNRVYCACRRQSTHNA